MKPKRSRLTHKQYVCEKIFEQGKLDYELVKKILREERPNQRPKYRFSYERLSRYIPEGVDGSRAEDFVVEALEYYTSHKRKRETDGTRWNRYVCCFMT